MFIQILILCASMFFLVKSATEATKHAALLAESYRLSKFVVGFIVVAAISILPETMVSISSALQGVPEFALGTLFGSNIADLTLVFAILVFVAGRNLKVESQILKKNWLFPLIIFIPLILGADGYFSRVDGAALIVIGGLMYYFSLKNATDDSLPFHNGIGRRKHLIYLLLSMLVLLVSSYFTVESAVSVAEMLKINPILIGLFIVGIGTVLPELFFSIKCVRKKDDSLAIGDLFGTVLADATIVVGILALISPFNVALKLLFSTGIFMVFASVLLLYCMHSGRNITKLEGALLFAYWLVFIATELTMNM